MAKDEPEDLPATAPAHVRDEGQAARNRHGEEFHTSVHRILERLLGGYGVHVVRMPKSRTKENPFLSVVGNQEVADDLLDRIRLPLKRPCDQRKADTVPDSDIVAIRQIQPDCWRILAIVNCKTTLHDRHLMACFWGLVFKTNGDIKYYLVTCDPEHEFGKECGGNEKRKRLETCTDGVFIVRDFSAADPSALDQALARVTKESRTNPEAPKSARHFDPEPPTTEYCRMVRPFSELVPRLADLR